MYSKRRQLPLEVSTWMERDLTLKRVTENSRLLTNDTRQNIILSRQFFSDLLTLSFERYRKLAEHDFNKRIFLKNQYNKAKTSMVGLLPCVLPHIDHSIYAMNKSSSRIQSSQKRDNSFISPSAQSFSSPGTKSDPMFNRRQQSSIRQIKTAQIIKPRPITTAAGNLTSTTNQRSPTGRQMSRERLNRLAQPKSFRSKSSLVGSDHVRSNRSEATVTTSEELFGGEFEQVSQVALPQTQSILPEKPKSVVHDTRFRELVDAFSEIYSAKTSNLQTRKDIVAANTSLQDDEGHWKLEHPSVSGHKTERKHHHEMLAENLRNKLDIFLIDVGA